MSTTITVNDLRAAGYARGLGLGYWWRPDGLSYVSEAVALAEVARVLNAMKEKAS
jgi:hypothetical protein